MGWINNWRLRRQQKRKLKEMAATASVFATLGKLEAGGMIHWDAKQRRMFIEQPIAVLMMRNADTWHNFVQNLYLYTYYNQCQAAWHDYILREELAAVRHAQTAAASTINLSRHDIERIRRQRRDEIVQSDMPAPKVEGFEFFLVSGNAQLIAVGYFHPANDTIEMAPWSEIQPLIQSKE